MLRVGEMYKAVETINKVKTIKRGEPGFTIIIDGFSIAPRAGFQINNLCPKEYKLILQECISNGWIEPVAYMTEQEFTWEELKK
jgi:hypothetical protein